MAWPFNWATQTITRIRPGTRSVRGSDIRDWGNASELEISGCSMQPAGNTLSQDGRVLGVHDGLTIYAPEDADIKAGDRIRYRGEMYAINGDPLIWPGAARMQHMQINVQRWRG